MRTIAIIGTIAIGALAAACTGVAATPAASVPASPGPAATPISLPSPSASARAALQYPQVQSYGTAVVTFTSPAIPPLTIDMPCEWESPTSVGSFYPDGRVAFGGEDVSFDVVPRGAPGSLFGIGREGAASYRGGSDTGMVALVSSSPDWSGGSIVFTDLAPDPDSADPGPIPTPLAEWVRPLGDDPTYARLSGRVEWSCEPAPATVPTPAPSVSEAPERTVPPVPALALVEGSRRDLGLDGCGGSIEIDGWVGSDSCGPSFQAPDASHIVQFAAGDDVRFELPAGWRFESWSLGWVSQVEAERWRGAVPDTFDDVASGGSTENGSITVSAPPVGDWTLLIVWAGQHGSDSVSTWHDYFRVVVSD